MHRNSIWLVARLWFVVLIFPNLQSFFGVNHGPTVVYVLALDENCLRTGECENTQNTPHYDVEEDLYRQIDFAMRANMSPITVVMESEKKNKGVFFVGDESLPPDTTIGLYRMFMIQKGVLENWIESGRIDKHAWEEFWIYYSVEFINGHDDNDGINNQNDDVWMGLPVGDVNGNIEEPSWWTYGILSMDQLNQAIMALNQRILVDWRRLASNSNNSLSFFHAHLLNEPSTHETENIGHLIGSGCLAFDGGTDLQYCGTAFEANTKISVEPGDELLWCYGPTFKRDSYLQTISPYCLQDSK